MILADYIDQLKALDIELWIDNGQLCFKAPQGIMTEEIKTNLKNNKKQIIELLFNSIKQADNPTPSYNYKEPQVIKLIDKSLVHKHNEENVLIYNLRRILPRKISAGIMENFITSSLSIEDRQFLLTYYKKETLFSPDPDYYYLQSIPIAISVEDALNFVQTNQINSDQVKILLRYYTRIKSTHIYILDEACDDEGELQILNIVKHKEWFINNFDKTRLSDILEALNKVEKKELFYANLYANPCHPFFFEHPLEHVPGLLLIEATRQLQNAIIHKYYNIPLTGVSGIFSSIQVSFKRFVELNFPAVIQVFSYNNIRPGYLLDGNMEMTIFQKNQEAASFYYTGSILETENFNLLREDDSFHKLRFHTRSVFYQNISIRDKENKIYLCTFIDLSDTGFQLQFKDSFAVIPANEFEFSIYFQEIGFAQGFCQLIWNDQEKKRAGFKIIKISEGDKNNLKEAIKRYCFVREEREE